MKQRSVEWETIFGQTKGNLNFRIFKLHGNEKVSVEWELLMIGQNKKRTEKTGKIKKIHRTFFLCAKKRLF